MEDLLPYFSQRTREYCLYKRKFSASNYMVKVNIRNTGTKREIFSKLTIKTPERCHCRRMTQAQLALCFPS